MRQVGSGASSVALLVSPDRDRAPEFVARGVARSQRGQIEKRGA